MQGDKNAKSTGSINVVVDKDIHLQLRKSLFPRTFSDWLRAKEREEVTKIVSSGMDKPKPSLASKIERRMNERLNPIREQILGKILERDLAIVPNAGRKRKK